MHIKKILTAGKTLDQTDKVLVMIHGRGSTAENILSLSGQLDVNEFCLIAPQASNNTWYPFSFMTPPVQNEPWLSAALSILKEVVMEIEESGVRSEDIYFLGFSQGACLTL